MEIKVHRLGLAAYIGITEDLLKFEDGVFTFKSEKTADQWAIEYSNTCCSKHDSLLCEYRKMYKKRI